mmetsp:Transcript_11194/g.25680  ORF Transcript_11194/g.25680 Transcript_11194/m.25680 type:complete len:243 (-) Transcript_11194:140-868(-)
MLTVGQAGEYFRTLPGPPDEYPPPEKRRYPERYTNDHIRDELPELEFQLEEAVTQNDIMRVHQLISKGANKDATLDKDGRTALMIASGLGWFDMVQHLVEVEGVDMDGVLSRSGLRAIDYAGKEQFRWPNGVPITDYLKSMGSQHTWWGAALAGDIRRMEVYLQHGQDIDDVNPVFWNYTALDCAIYGGCGKAAQYLVARGALITIRNAQVPFFEEMMYDNTRDAAFYYKEIGVEKGPFIHH